MQREITTIQQGPGGAPFAEVTEDFDFFHFAERVSLDTPEGIYEHNVWTLAGILFDDLSSYLPHDLSQGQYRQNEARYRKEKLTSFWQKLVQSDVDQQAYQARSPEDKALAYLTGHNIVDACGALVEGKDFRLATLISQINGSQVLREDMAAQIDSWQNLNVLSEMSEPIRAMYELLAGNCSECEGKNDTTPENKVKSFKFSKQFGLDWRRAFGLRLWYGTLKEEPVSMAVAQFADDLREGREGVKPVPWFIEQGVYTGWDDPAPDTCEDLLWGLLKLHAAQEMDVHVNIEDVLAPASVSGNPLNARLSWQLLQLLRSKDSISRLPTDRRSHNEVSFMSSTSSINEKDSQAEDALTEVSDALTITYASTLHNPVHFTTALYIYSHLSKPANRTYHIKTLLAHLANAFETEDRTDATYVHLTKELKIPAEFLHEAKALYARAVRKDRVAEVEHLCEARLWEEAHEVLCRAVAPEAIIAHDFDRLREVLGAFEDAMQSHHDMEQRRNYGTGKPKTELVQTELVPGWRTGGQIYFDYIHLLDLEKSGPAQAEERPKVLRRLSTALEAVMSELGVKNLEERVALQEIAERVGVWVARGEVSSLRSSGLYWNGTDGSQTKAMSKAKALSLPLMDDAYLRYSRELSVGYYKAVLASGR